MVWETIFEHLKKDGFDVYSPGTKKGECKSKYIVVKVGGGSGTSFSTDQTYYDVMMYVPDNRYSELDNFVSDVKKSMKKLYPLVKPTGEETPSYYDDTYKAHMVSVVYSNYKKR